jgi:DNA-directed RNA polymerase subunit N (RpoN/RPB10)
MTDSNHNKSFVCVSSCIANIRCTSCKIVLASLWNSLNYIFVPIRTFYCMIEFVGNYANILKMEHIKYKPDFVLWDIFLCTLDRTYKHHFMLNVRFERA